MSLIPDPSSTAFDLTVDACGLACPLPILRAKKALATLESGQVLQLLSSDAGSVQDLQAFAKQTGNRLLSYSHNGSVFTFFLKRK